jgi:hypothetical protein
MKIAIDGNVIDVDSIIKISEPARYFGHEHPAWAFKIDLLGKYSISIIREFKGVDNEYNKWYNETVPEEHEAKEKVSKMHEALLEKWGGQKIYEDLTQ